MTREMEYAKCMAVLRRIYRLNLTHNYNIYFR